MALCRPMCSDQQHLNGCLSMRLPEHVGGGGGGEGWSALRSLLWLCVVPRMVDGQGCSHLPPMQWC